MKRTFRVRERRYVDAQDYQAEGYEVKDGFLILFNGDTPHRDGSNIVAIFGNHNLDYLGVVKKD